MVARLLGLADAAATRSRRRRARGRGLRRSTGRRWRARSPEAARMIALVTGTVAVRRADHVIVDCGGVGYRLSVSSETLRHVPAVGNRVTLHTHLIPRDDALHAVRLRQRGGARPLPDAAGRPVGRARRSRSRCSPAARRASCWRRSRPVTAPASRPSRASASAPPSGSSSSCVRRSASACPSRRSASSRSDDPRAIAREGLIGLGYSPQEVDALLDGLDGETPEELIAEALRAARR